MFGNNLIAVNVGAGYVMLRVCADLLIALRYGHDLANLVAAFMAEKSQPLDSTLRSIQ